MVSKAWYRFLRMMLWQVHGMYGLLHANVSSRPHVWLKLFRLCEIKRDKLMQPYMLCAHEWCPVVPNIELS